MHYVAQQLGLVGGNVAPMVNTANLALGITPAQDSSLANQIDLLYKQLKDLFDSETQEQKDDLLWETTRITAEDATDVLDSARGRRDRYPEEWPHDPFAIRVRALFMKTVLARPGQHDCQGQFFMRFCSRNRTR